MKHGRKIIAGVLLAAMWLAVGVAVAEQPSDPNRILIKDFMFAPMTLTTKVGATVTWINQDDEPHTVVSETGVFRSGALDTNEAYTFKFDKPGTYRVYCSFHSQMLATIVVE
jgi:plastocyanin